MAAPILTIDDVENARSRADANEERIWQELEQIVDPEFPVSIVDMGLIYGVSLSNASAHILMTFTAMGCPCMEMMLSDIREQIQHLPFVDTVMIDIVWDPPWTRARLSEKAIEQLKIWGVTT